MTNQEYVEFVTEMERLKKITWQGYGKTLKEVGIAYLGNVAHSTKMLHSYLHHISTYCIYLSSGDLSGIETCNKKYSVLCRQNCLMGSGQNKLSRLSTSSNHGFVDKSRNLKTRLFYANRQVFMRIMLHEIEREMRRADIKGHEFSIRINATSDINPTTFYYIDEVIGKKNLFEKLPQVQFYDYTKVPSRLELAKQYKNYDVTWSIDGGEENLRIGLDYLKQGGRVAVVFGTDTFPKKWHGYDVINGDESDARYHNGNVVVGLKFKKTANNYKNGKFIMPNTKFIVMGDDKNCEW